MTVRIPWLQIFAPSGRNIAPGLGGALLGVTITDNEGLESDECVIRMADKPPFNSPPPKGTKYRVLGGWRDGGGGTVGGLYSFETYRKSGDPEEGKTIELVCRAADFVDKMKQAGSAHYDEENGHGTAGKIFETLAKEAGVEAAIDASLASIKIPYRLRWNQSAIDFASDLAADLGAIVKPQMGRLVVRPRGKGTSAGGLALGALRIVADEKYQYDFDIDPRPQHKEVATPWFDPAEGRIKEAIEAARGEFARAALMHPAASEEEAKLAGKAAGTAMNQATGSGSVQMAGDAAAIAGAPATLSGYGADIDSLSWEIATATHTISAEEDGWITDVSLQTRE
jgi:Bacteriophage probable baseplate hub protein